MRRPWLIQRCELVDGKLRYDYMGATEFEIGGQTKSLRRIFALGVATGSVTVSLDGEEVSVYMVAGEGFSFADYQEHLQDLADRKFRPKEWICFDDALRVVIGTAVQESHRRTNVWFDFENDVLWTVTSRHQEALVAVLEDIRLVWAEK